MAAKKPMPLKAAMKKWEGSPMDRKLDKKLGVKEESPADKKMDKAGAKKMLRGKKC